MQNFVKFVATAAVLLIYYAPRCAFALSPADGPTSAETAADAFFKQNATGLVLPMTRKALVTFLTAQQQYRVSDFRGAQKVLNELWAEYPAGTDVWFKAGAPQVYNIGLPSCYYALRMLTDCCAWKLERPNDLTEPKTVTLAVILPGHSRGAQPRTISDLKAGTSPVVTHNLNEKLLANNSAVIHRSLWLFKEYVNAITRGKIKVEEKVYSLPNFTLPVRATGLNPPFLDLDGPDLYKMWPKITDAIGPAHNWYWIIYPSNVPEGQADFKTKEVITGGMSAPPGSPAPLFMIDDLWLVRRPPHLGTGAITDVEIDTYMPQWLQHEFFHHVFGAYPEFGLEASGHQWFHREKWPADFVGIIEPDYYHEAIYKRVQPKGDPPLNVKLRYGGPDKSILHAVTLSAVVGVYRHEPVENPWHEGTLQVGSTLADGTVILSWRNKANVSWRLLPKMDEGYMLTGPENPYYAQDTVMSRRFVIVLKRDKEGNYLPEVDGFSFLNAFYRRISGGK